MSNRERYKRAFQALHAPNHTMEETMKMKRSIFYSVPRAALVAAMVCILLMGLFSVACAADIGGLRQVVNLWIHGKPTEVAVTQGEDNGFTVTWEDEDGEVHEMGGGGVAYENGIERPVTMEEYLDQLQNDASVEKDARGRVMLYYYDQAVDITDAFDDADNCRIALAHNGKTAYVTIHGDPEEGLEIWQSTDGFDDPVPEEDENAETEKAVTMEATD